MCPCVFTKSNVDEESFAACNEKLTEYVTFQARLSGTSDNDSKYLISLLTKWVSTSPRIIVSGLQMEIANNELKNCTTALLYLGEDCLADNEPSSKSGVSTAIVLAIAVPIATIMGGLITMVSTIVTIWIKCGKPQNKK